MFCLGMWLMWGRVFWGLALGVGGMRPCVWYCQGLRVFGGGKGCGVGIGLSLLVCELLRGSLVGSGVGGWLRRGVYSIGFVGL